MAETVAGVGKQKSLHGIFEISDKELKKSSGIPGRVTAWAEPIRMKAERKDFDSDFSSFTIHIDADDELAEKLESAAQKLGDACEHIVENGTHTLICPPPGATDQNSGVESVDAISKCITIPEVWRFDGDKYRSDPISIDTLFRALLKYKASDIHLAPGEKPIFRVDNIPRQAEIIGIMSSVQILDLLKNVAPEKYWHDFEKEKQTSFGYHQAGLGFARVSAFLKSGSPHITFRYLPEKVPSFDELHVPADTMKELAALKDGLVLIVGMTGSGKSTTSAALVDWINTNRMCHILTIEDPIEFVHVNKKAFVSQRSLGEDVNSFGEGVEGALRQDPDVIVIGEMVDADTIRAAINAASTGHLVISTLHSNSAYAVINRIVSFFDPVERDLVRQQLQDSLRCVICQKLVPKKGGGRIPGLEILLNDIKPISNNIVSGDTLGIKIAMQSTLSHSILFELYLHKMYEDGLITVETAKAAAPELDMFDQILMGTYSVPRLQ